MASQPRKGQRSPESQSASRERILAAGESLRVRLLETGTSGVIARIASLDLNRTRQALADYTQRLEQLETAYSLSSKDFAKEMRKRRPEVKNMDAEELEQWRALLHMRKQAQRRLEKLLAKGAA